MEASIKQGPKAPWKYTPEFIDSLAEKLRSFADASNLPLLERFCNENSLQVQRISELASKNDNFSEALSYFKQEQKTKWIEYLATAKVSPSGIIFILKNITDMRDEKHIRATVEEMISFKVDRGEVEDANRLTEYLNDNG